MWPPKRSLPNLEVKMCLKHCKNQCFFEKCRFFLGGDIYIYIYCFVYLLMHVCPIWQGTSVYDLWVTRLTTTNNKPTTSNKVLATPCMAHLFQIVLPQSRWEVIWYEIPGLARNKMFLVQKQQLRCFGNQLQPMLRYDPKTCLMKL